MSDPIQVINQANVDAYNMANQANENASQSNVNGYAQAASVVSVVTIGSKKYAINGAVTAVEAASSSQYSSMKAEDAKAVFAYSINGVYAAGLGSQDTAELNSALGIEDNKVAAPVTIEVLYQIVNAQNLTVAKAEAGIPTNKGFTVSGVPSFKNGVLTLVCDAEITPKV